VTVVFVREGERAYNIGIWELCPLGAFQDHIILAGKLTLIVVLATVLLTLVLGRVFCGWLCPFGAFTTLLGNVPSARKVFSRWYKYWALLLVIAATAYLMTVPVFCSFCPAAGAFSIFGPARQAATPELTYLRYGLFGAVVIGTAALGNFWCTSLCPLGGALSAVSRLRLFRLRVGPECSGCGKCDDVCEMNIRVSKEEGMEECNLCWNCVEVCPYKDIAMGTIFS